MKIFKELKKLGYKHYTEHTVEELDNLPLESKERIMEQALVLRWFREKYSYQSFISPSNELTYLAYDFTLKGFDGYFKSKQFKTYEEAEFECLKKLIEIVKNK